MTTTTWQATRTGDPISDPRLRAGDADRDAVVQILRRHHLEGRLTTDELQDRVDCAYQARTLGELDLLLADLPRDAQPAPARARRWQRRWALIAVSLVIALAALSAASGHHVIWLALPLLLISRLVLRTTAPRRPFGPAPQDGPRVKRSA